MVRYDKAMKSEGFQVAQMRWLAVGTANIYDRDEYVYEQFLRYIKEGPTQWGVSAKVNSLVPTSVKTKITIVFSFA